MKVNGRVLQRSSQQNKNFNWKRVRVVCYLEQKTNPNRNIQQTFNTNTAKPTDAKQRGENHRYFCCYAAFCRTGRRSLTLVESETKYKQQTPPSQLSQRLWNKQKKVTTKYEKPNKQKYVLDKSDAESTKSPESGGAQTFAKNSTLNKQVVYRLKQNKNH